MRTIASLATHLSLGVGVALASTLATGCDESSGVEPVVCLPGSTDPACSGGDAAASTGLNGDSTGLGTGLTGLPTTGTGGDVLVPQPAKDLPCDVLDVLETHCMDCHGAARKYGAPMSLVESADFHVPSSVAGVSMVDRTLQKLTDAVSPMPPTHLPRLSDEEMTTLKTWLSGGATAATANACGVDVPVETDAGVGTDAGPSDEPLFFPEAPDDCQEYFQLTAHGGNTEDDPSPYDVPVEPLDSGNQYMCFYFSLPYEPGSQGLWFDPVIGDDRVLHHWLLYGTNNAAHPAGSSGACSAAEPGAYLLAGWAPGADAYRYPSDVGLHMPTGVNAGLILEVHYYNTEKLVAQDRSGVKFCTAPGGTREHTAGVHFLGSEGICVQPDQLADVSGECRPRQDMGDIHILNMWPHMHKLGRNMKAVRHRPGAADEVLFDKPFDFNNQINYPQDDVIIKPGDRITATCSFYNDTDQAVHFGDRTQDEMCYLFVTAWPVDALSTNPGDLEYGTANPINAIGSLIQPSQRCLNPTGIFGSCNGLGDYPTSF